MIDIPHYIIEFANSIAPRLVPKARASGWSELSTETRGNGDLMDLVGSLMLFDKLTSAGKVCRMDLTCGTGDKSDIDVRVKNSFKKINIKTSSYAPYHNRLNLIIKEEELNKNIDAYIQCFVHMNEGDLAPHIHMVGWIPTTSDIWRQYSKNVVEIPNTDGHKGIKVPVSKLGSIDSLLNMIDDKF